MPYESSQLSRVTPGEIGRNQAVIDYFYYGPDVTIQEVMSEGFFDKAGYLFYTGKNHRTWERISILAQRGYGTAPHLPEKYSAVVSDVTVVPTVNQKPTEFKVTIALGPDTSFTTDDTNPPPVIPWFNFFIKYQGICRYLSNYTPVSPAVIDIVSNYSYDASDFSTAILFSDKDNPNQPTPGDAIVASYVEPGVATSLRLRLIPAGVTSSFNQRAWVTIYSTQCKFI